MALSNEGLELIRQLEGCRLAAYPDPGSGGAPWTVGYGHTGAEVTPGLVISQAQAEAWLRADVAEAEGAVDQLLAGAALSSWQREALVSFCFNVGAGALADSSLRRRLLAGEEAEVVLSAELPRWVNGAEGPLAGLVRRRQLELLHSRRGSAAIELPVPYFAQNDSSTDQGLRMCFSSTCAMAAEFLRPGCLSHALAVRRAHPQADGFPLCGVIRRLHGRRLGPQVDGSNRADFFADTGGLLRALVPVRTEKGSKIQLDQLLQAEACQFRDQLPGTAAIE